MPGSSSDIGVEVPNFVLSRPTDHVSAFGADVRFDTVDAARAALYNRSHEHIVGALPFDPNGPAALTAPARFARRDVRWQPDAPTLPAVTIAGFDPEPAEHVRRVAAAIRVLSDPHASLAKVVLARTVILRAREFIDPVDLLTRLVAADPGSNGLLVDLSPAGPPYTGAHLIGSSPELLVRKSGSTVIGHPLAGSAPRAADAAEDRANGEMLAASAKDQREHAFVVDAMATALAPLCIDLDVPATPTLTQTPDMWHLGTRIVGTVRDPATTALDLAVALHPTPAVCGTPTADAREFILANEGDRGFYAGAVGWCAGAGDGEWMVGIRCAELSADGLTIRASAGGGIVSDSDPQLELAETSAKLRTILSALGR
ncbi:isochorismate synthase [Williamsia sp. 1135]|nr:isochorismate synthase [Williamsia sp. 1135]